MLLSTSKSLCLFLVFLLAFGCGSRRGQDEVTEQQAVGLLQDIRVHGALKNESLGVDFKIGGSHGSAYLEISNNSKEPLSVGNDEHIWAEGGDIDTILLIAGANRSDQQDRLLAYACGARMVSGVKDGKLVRYIFGPGGQGFELDSSAAKDYKGSWPAEVSAGGKATIAQQIMTWPGSDRGWVATPVLRLKDGPRFRIIAPLGDAANRTPILLAMAPKGLAAILTDKSQPLPIRRWAGAWLTSLSENEGWKEAVPIVCDKNTDLEVRTALVKSLATQAPAEALTTIDQVLWDGTTPKELQLQCFYALTWSPHQEAKELIKKAAKHPNDEVSAEAKKSAVEK